MNPAGEELVVLGVLRWRQLLDRLYEDHDAIGYRYHDVQAAFLARDAGLKLMACGAISGSVPYIVQSAYFSIIVSGALLIALLIALYHFWWKVKQSEQNAEEEKKS